MQTTSMPWYNRDSYERIRALMADGERFPPDFETWSSEADRSRRARARHGEVVYRVIIDPDDFVAWCSAHERAADDAAREEYAHQAMELLFRTGRRKSA
ncbi:hypothetical protein [Parvibaculum sp.]|jgi:hypothetical protein|uniref:hypothetical protein n=1 Tax=Parvibaculum sp. TaxID=2024848 RepID=UPI001B10D240|nr:hypothetical protein [Parvibaculum sp.]MBO6635497.1 hypothetical protein [Parvibaculum sp.]MBO6678201.1 hypothetical protein [Parvibaculum sp.]MBO6685759.1 hypothetical protein [Parvibaculum sp.]MBO6904562.1 hypothetical protein [Parvibaculum sp.]